MLLSLVTQSALACGGFFCNAVQPIDQAGEEIVFEVNPDTQTTNMHVRVQYTGPAAEFAWLVPVANQPTLGVGTDRLFNALEPPTRPGYALNWNVETCEDGAWELQGRINPPLPAPAGSPDSSFDLDDDGEVSVIEQAIGPYDTAVISGDSQEAIVNWLQENDYAVPDAIGDRLAPYVASRHYFVALRLQSDRDTGDLVPITLSYDGTTPVVPLTLTGVAATPDMPLRIYMLGPARAVPTNYLHVVVNDAAVDWFQAWNNPRGALVSRAADEAGGQAFATDFAGPAADFGAMVHPATWTSEGLADAQTPTEFANLVNQRGFQYDGALTAFFQDLMPISDPAFDNVFSYQCPECVDLDSLVVDFDAGEAALAFENRIVTPIREAAEMFDRNAVLTRLASSASPEEMTLDPQFGVNADMPATVDRTRMADLHVACEPGQSSLEAPMRLDLEDGHSILVPSWNWLAEQGMTPSDWIAGLEEPFAVRIERTDLTGQPEVLFDGRDIVQDNIDGLNDEVPNSQRAEAGCGCSTGASPAAGGLILGLLGLLARRRVN